MLRLCVFVIGSLPAAYIGLQVYMLQVGKLHRLGPDPAKELVLTLGEWAMHFLILTLLITPMRKITGWVQFSKFRRMLGLFVFFYASLHLLAYNLLLLELKFSALAKEVIERPYITVGFFAWLLLLPLAATSTPKMVRTLGNSWRKLHRLVYGVAILAIFHVFWLAKSSYLDALIYGMLLLLLLAYRLLVWKNKLFLQAPKDSA